MKTGILGLAWTVLATAVLSPSASACPPEVARTVEERLSEIETWSAFSAFYSAYGRCDRSALRYAFTQRIATLAQDPQALPDLGQAVRHNAPLRQAILRHLASESIPAGQAERIREGITQRCPKGDQPLCDAMSTALDAAATK